MEPQQDSSVCELDALSNWQGWHVLLCLPVLEGRRDSHGFRVEFAVDLSDHEESDRIYRGIEGQRSEVEDRFGENLVWDEVEGRQIRRIYAWHPSGEFDIKDRERWPEVREWAIKRLGELRDAIQPHLNNLADDGA